MVTKKASQTFQVGDHLKILHSANWRGRVVELRGPLGPGGIVIYRVRIPGKPKPTYIEIREDQLVALPRSPKGKPHPVAGGHSPGKGKEE
jgi:hypothetical protein